MSSETSPILDEIATVEGAQNPTSKADGPQGRQLNDSSAVSSDSAIQEETPPPKPPRPVFKLDAHIRTLKEAFPGTENNVIKAVLQASGGNIESAFNALLGMTDPSYVIEDHPPPQPRRPVPSGSQTSTPLTQIEADEHYARQLAEHYNSNPRGPRQFPAQTSGDQQPEHCRKDSDEREYSFLDDDLPVIKENIRKGFLETQSKVNKWVADFKKKLDGEDSDGPVNHGGTSEGRGIGADRPLQQHQFPPRGASRKSGDAYDADPRVIDEDFSHLELKENTRNAPHVEHCANRPIANRNLFSTGSQHLPSGGRKVSFQEQTDDDLYRPPPSNPLVSGSLGSMPPSAMRQPSSIPVPSTESVNASTSSRWAPLEAVEPTPFSNDPFSLGDSDDDHETAPTEDKTGPQESGLTTTEKEQVKK